MTQGIVAAMADPDAFLNHLFGPEGGGSAQRPWVVLDWCATLGADDGRAFWQVILGAWSMFDRIPHEEFAAQFARFASNAPPKPDLPGQLTVYRGQDDSAPLGLSWTLSRDVAEGFARGHRNIRNPDPVVLALDVSLSEVAFFTNDREEQEVVLLAMPHDRADVVG